MKNQEINMIYPHPEGYSMEHYDPEILEALKTRMMRALEKSSRILLVRLDFRYPKNLEDWRMDNECMAFFMELYTMGHQEILLEYVWVREQAESEHCHWHAVFFFDKNKMRYFASPSRETSLWNTAIHKLFFVPLKKLPQWGLVESAPSIRNGMVVKRGDDVMIEGALRIISYLAKKATKGNMPEWGASNE